MLDGQDIDAHGIARDWLDRFLSALEADTLNSVFVQDCHWRDLVALTGEIRTRSGPAALPVLADRLRSANARNITLHPTKVPPEALSRAGEDVIEAAIAFETDLGTCDGMIRIRRDSGKAWTLSTSLDDFRKIEQPPEPAYAKDVRAPNWLDNRDAARAYADRDPVVLVVGGGHAGITAAARLGAMGVDTLVIDKEKRIGDNWRLRYHNLKLHNQINVNHMPYLEFPKTWPRYIPKDMIANWLEFYVEALEINFWTETEFLGAVWDADARGWVARIRQADGSERIMRPHHIIMAASTSAVKKLPDLPSLANFDGTLLHASEFEVGSEWTDRPVMVLGTGTSSHDISQHLHAHGAKVTMVQRSPTMVVNVDPSAQIYDGLYLGDWENGPTLDERDLVNTSFTLDLIKRAHQIVTTEVRDIDRETHEGLERAGFELEYGEDGTGWPLKYRTRGGGYYFNIGCSELIIDGEIDLIQHRDIDHYIATGVRMKDGTERPTELIVMATGYETQGAMMK
ncbi:MAG: NAD(P)/FAD-dependent oxidoreductase, partial [Pseudomonadota bacterium]